MLKVILTYVFTVQFPLHSLPPTHILNTDQHIIVLGIGVINGTFTSIFYDAVLYLPQRAVLWQVYGFLWKHFCGTGPGAYTLNLDQKIHRKTFVLL